MRAVPILFNGTGLFFFLCNFESTIRFLVRYVVVTMRKRLVRCMYSEFDTFGAFLALETTIEVHSATLYTFLNSALT